MKAITAVIICAAGLGTLALIARKRECAVSMHPEDWLGLEEKDTHRRYRSLGHAFHHVSELAFLSGHTAALYLLRPVTPAFREQIMLLTAVCDDCPG